MVFQISFLNGNIKFFNKGSTLLNGYINFFVNCVKLDVFISDFFNTD